MSTYIADATSENEPFKLSIPNHGTLTGYKFKSSITNEFTTVRYSKVPYALPLKDESRWTLPKEIPDDYDYTGDYGKVGLKCPQPSVANPIFNYKKSPSQEDIQYLNIFVPIGEPPEGGWPVMVYLHGGWLQYNSPNHMFTDSSDFNSEFKDKFILILVGYRLNIFGFLSSKELLEENPSSSNFGFWDQRLAIEWTYKYISFFGGNPEKVTVAGISAGGYSTFFQLAYEVYHPEAPQVIKQAVLQSNAVYCQPKSIEETQVQFDEIVTKLGLKELSSEEKLAKLRSIPMGDLEDLIPTLDYHTFRAVTDDKFVSSTMIKDIYTGEFAKKLTAKGCRIVTGEVDNEPWKYSILNTPKTKEELSLQVENYYPAKVIKPLLELYKDIETLDPKDPEHDEKLRIIFGDITADGQIYASERGFINQLVKYGFPQENIYRYRISYRAKFNDAIMPKELKVIHGLDFSLWFFRMKDYEEDEIKIAKNWMQPFVDYLSFKEVKGWKSDDYLKLNLLNESGEIEYTEDSYWKRGVEVAEAVYKAQV